MEYIKTSLETVSTIIFEYLMALMQHVRSEIFTLTDKIDTTSLLAKPKMTLIN